jgi:hypothetical protein
MTITPTTIALSSGTGTGTALPLPSSLQNYIAAEADDVETLANPGCADSNAHIETPRGSAFDLFCGVDMLNTVPDETNPDLTVADIVGIFAYSITDCLYACANAIFFGDKWGDGFVGDCKGVTWSYQMAESNSSNYANCWLKNGTSTGYQCNTCISAKLSTV